MYYKVSGDVHNVCNVPVCNTSLCVHTFDMTRMCSSIPLVFSTMPVPVSSVSSFSGCAAVCGRVARLGVDDGVAAGWARRGRRDGG